LLLGGVAELDGTYPGAVFEGMAEPLGRTEAYPLERPPLGPGDETGYEVGTAPVLLAGADPGYDIEGTAELPEGTTTVYDVPT
jgi:hypothetical protein